MLVRMRWNVIAQLVTPLKTLYWVFIAVHMYLFGKADKLDLWFSMKVSYSSQESTCTS